MTICVRDLNLVIQRVLETTVFSRENGVHVIRRINKLRKSLAPCKRQCASIHSTRNNAAAARGPRGRRLRRGSGGRLCDFTRRGTNHHRSVHLARQSFGHYARTLGRFHGNARNAESPTAATTPTHTCNGYRII